MVLAIRRAIARSRTIRLFVSQIDSAVQFVAAVRPNTQREMGGPYPVVPSR